MKKRQKKKNIKKALINVRKGVASKKDMHFFNMYISDVTKVIKEAVNNVYSFVYETTKKINKDLYEYINNNKNEGGFE